MLNRDEFNRIFGRLCNTFGKRSDPQRADEYFAILSESGVSDRELSEAAASVVKSSRFFPQVGELIRAVESSKPVAVASTYVEPLTLWERIRTEVFYEIRDECNTASIPERVLFAATFGRYKRQTDNHPPVSAWIGVDDKHTERCIGKPQPLLDDVKRLYEAAGKPLPSGCSGEPYISSGMFDRWLAGFDRRNWDVRFVVTGRERRVSAFDDWNDG